MAAAAEPVFISPLAEPENRGAMSMGIAHIGPIVNSAKKNCGTQTDGGPVQIMQKENGHHEYQRRIKPMTTRLRA